uniref:GMC_oxred_C domain-containing protein n=1 Tax=Ascaris lumbricoides TaxID=6252 RepID=A0A0M3IH49_ASCLU
MNFLCLVALRLHPIITGGRREDSLRKLPTLSATLSTSTMNKNSNADFYVTFSSYCSQSKWAISVQVSLLNSYRSGSIRLQSSDASLPPIIEIQSREPFIDLLTKVALRVHSLFMTNSFAKLGIRTSRWQHKECNNDEPSERFFLCLIGKSRANLFPSHTSSCAMGNMLTNSVVDKYLRVHGVKRLRVVDASVLPPIASVRGALSSVLMLAERAAKIISDAYRNTSIVKLFQDLCSRGVLGYTLKFYLCHNLGILLMHVRRVVIFRSLLRCHLRVVKSLN